MNKKKPIRLEELINVALAYAREDASYQAAVRSGALGRQSDVLREEATFGAGRGNPALSHSNYEKAASLHLPSDHSAAAAAARHDLAESYKDLPTGIRVENLLRAQTLYREALRSRERDKFPSRAAMTRACLASCLRQLAEESHDPEQEAAHGAESTALLQEAITLSERRGAAGWIDTVSYLNTLGNLQLQQDLFDSAVSTFNRAESFAGRLRSLLEVEHKDFARARIPHLPSYQQAALRMFREHALRDHVLEQFLLGSASARLARGKAGDREHAKRLLNNVIKNAPSPFGDRARMALAHQLRKEGDSNAARELLQGVRHANLPPDMLPHLAEEHELLGQSEAALQLLHESIEEAIEQRKQHTANHPADHLAMRAQTAAAVAARIYAKQKQPLTAFLVLERCAGFRYEESLRHFIWRPKDRFTRAIWERRWIHSTCSGMLETLASHLTYARPETHVQILKEISEEYQNSEDAREPRHASMMGDRTYLDLLREQVQGARLALDPIQDLRRRGHELRDLALALDDIVEERDHAGYQAWHHDQYASSDVAILKILQQYPGYVLLRFCLREELLVLCVYLKNGELEAASLSLELPARLFALLQALRDDPRPDKVNHAELTTALTNLDISQILPPDGGCRAVLLPSLLSSFLPLAALGPPGRTILDHFESIVWMPTTAGLLNRQDAHPPRSGSLLVIPQQTYTKDTTELHNIAFANLQPNDMVLASDTATMAAVATQMAHRDVLSIYSHGQHEGDTGPYLELRDGKLDISFGQERHWHGLERAELWGCQSGVNIPHDPLTPAVDEGFGFDYTLLSYGVRTAIGTLWKVSEIVTAYLVYHYRKQLALGADAATALARAQRGWRDDGMARLADCLAQSADPTAGVRKFLQDYAAQDDVGETSAARLLGAGKTLRDSELRPFLDWFRCPATWGGYRFLGIPEQRPKRAWTVDDERPLTDAEQNELAAIEQKARESVAKSQADDCTAPSTEAWNEHDLTTAAALAPGCQPTPEQALLVARRYRDRLLCAHADNVLRGLAWLHEALLDPELSPTWRARLSLEAAHLWLELAEGETVSPSDLTWPRAPHPEPLARARVLLDNVPLDFEPSDAAAARALLGFLERLAEKPLRDADDWLSQEGTTFILRKEARLHPERAMEAYEKLRAVASRSALGRAVGAAAPMLEQVAQGSGSFDYSHRRAIAVACKILRAAPQELPAVVNALLSAASEQLGRGSQVPVEEHASLGRMDLAQLDLRLLASPTNPVTMLNIGPLSAPDLVRWFQLKQQLLHSSLPGPAAAVHDNVGQPLAVLEGHVWGGCRSLDRQIFWRTTGTLGHSYRVLLSSFLGGLPPDEAHMRNAAHTIACLQLACNLRLPILQRAIDFGFASSRDKLAPFKYLWWSPLRQKQILAALHDSALLDGASSQYDPFAQSIQQLLPGQVSTPYTAQILAILLRVSSADPNARTAAFAATRALDGMTNRLVDTWQTLRKAEGSMEERVGVKNRDYSLGKFFDPRMIIDEWTEFLQSLSAGHAFLGFFVGARNSIWCAVCWSTREGVKQKVASSDPGIANQVRSLLLALTTASNSDKQQTKWNHLLKLLQPVLDEVLTEAVSTAKLHFYVLAPGALRALPWLGLPVQGTPLGELAASVFHIPALGLPRQTPPPREDVALKTACWLAPCDSRYGQTQFGEAANASLRAIDRPAWILDLQGSEQEAPLHSLLSSGERIECLRFYGMEGPMRTTGTAAGFHCGNGQVYLSVQLPAPLMHCQLAEVWAATSGQSELEFLARDDGDAVPGLAGALLDHGAMTVLDLAWPVPDLVKAMVYEIYACYRAKLLEHPAVVLLLAIGQTRSILTDWHANRRQFTSLAEAHAWLDKERRQYLSALDPAVKGFVPFVAIAIPDPLSVEEYIAAMREPVHLAAFRFWGG